MIPSASPLALIARAAPLGDAVAGQDALAQGDTGFSALFAGLLPDGEETAAQPDAQALAALSHQAKAAKLAAMGGRLPQAATETGKKLPLSLSQELAEAETGEDAGDAAQQDPTLDPAAQLALAITTLTLPTAVAAPTPQTASVQRRVTSQAGGETAPLAASTTFIAPPVTNAATAKPSAATIDPAAQPSVELTVAPEPTPAPAQTETRAETRPTAMATASQLQFQMQALPVVEGKPTRAVTAAAADAAEPVETVAPAQDKPVVAAPEPRINAAAPVAIAAKQQKPSDRKTDTASQRPADLLTAATASPALAPAFTAATPGTLPTSTHSPAASTATQHAQDVARIIDQLAAAREAFAPATAALTIDHAEFGALSLRIDQRPDGGLAVQLAASNPEAHRAVSAAMNAQGGGQSTQGDSQPGSPSAQGNAPSANGNSADRNARGGTAQGRQDQPSGQRRNAATTTGSEPQSGTFA